MRQILILLLIGAGPLTASAACEDSLTAGPGKGLCFQAGLLPAASADGNQLMVWLGPGYDFSSRLSLELLFQTGHLHVSPAPRRPVSGTLLLGGASLELRVRLLDTGPAGWMVGGGGGLSTTLLKNGSGYNGSGVSLMSALTFSVFRDLEAAPILRCGWWTWRNGVGGGVEPFDAFTQFWYGAGLTLTFRPRM